ncbi:hypothetical protein AQUCO_00700931v1 [Aquilegia coerulea]|uniref:MLO-like protein n=1 Tax=Aquilegia coerulea TaxID=218851 RepID=A0A2G5EMG5_AQUCA|nr:hypothetical protein AQUCO_00700931v1 [Aquilegia coerulea]
MAGGGDANSRQLDQTPTWAVATVVAVIIIVSIILEKVIHRLGKWFTEKHKSALFEALEKVKGELMVLGFISLILTFCQVYIAKICVPYKAADSMLPCPSTRNKSKDESSTEEHRRRLLWNDRRFLAGGSATTSCREIRGWKQWEKETLSHDYEFSNDPARFRLTHETSFVRAHTSFWTRIPFLFYIVSFFRQFFRSVRKADYLTMRHGFITVHLAPGSKFDFQKYIKRSLEDDFKVVVGISPFLWATVVIFMLLNVNGWQALFWASIIPLVIILAVGTKLQAIITQMAIDIQERHAVVQGIPLVQVSDKYFWFSWPPLILYLIHFTLFQNAFQISYFLWIWYEFGLKSCFHENFTLIVIRVALGVAVQVLCSYITLPLYALVTQMGTNMKKSIFDEQTSRALKNWHRAAVKKKKDEKSGKSPRTTPSVSPMQSPAHPLHRFQTTGHSTRSSFNSRRYPETDLSDTEGDNSPTSSTANLIAHMDNGDLETGTNDRSYDNQGGQPSNEDDFSFVKPAVLGRP